MTAADRGDTEQTRNLEKGTPSTPHITNAMQFIMARGFKMPKFKQDLAKE
ncbi:hypothetical protein AN958_04592 [Leucoagaricus sp. SymC.cos]|nr:hypothetical protein AN958_04592 [Leucoagaricus sp. SymC.cos]